MEIVLDGEHLTTADVLIAARDRAHVILLPEGLERVHRCRAFLERQIESGTLMYGVNTGIGELVDVILRPDQIRDFQRYLVYSHAAGYGDPLPEEVVRAAWVSRLNLMLKGHSGCRAVVPETSP